MSTGVEQIIKLREYAINGGFPERNDKITKGYISKFNQDYEPHQLLFISQDCWESYLNERGYKKDHPKTIYDFGGGKTTIVINEGVTFKRKR